MDEALYTTKTKMTWDEYVKYSFNVFFRKRGVILLYLLSLLYAAFVAFATRWTGPDKYVITVLIVLAALLILYPLILVAKSKSYYKSNGIINGGDAETELRFYEDRFKSLCGENVSVLTYDKIYKIIETKTNFYIMISTSQGMVVVKSNCPDGLEDFLRELKGRIKKK